MWSVNYIHYFVEVNSISFFIPFIRGGRGGRGPPAGFVPNPVQAPQSYAPPPAPGANYGQVSRDFS